MSECTEERFVCPFCGLTVFAKTSWVYDRSRAEKEIRMHLLRKHPIRWRLSRKFRQAMNVHRRLA